MDHDESARQPHRQDGKGKGKGKPAGEDMALDHSEPRFDAPIEARPTTGSTISRIADSATNLASNLLPNPAHSELAAQILPPSKAGSSTTAFRPSLGETSNYRSQPIEGAAGQSFKSAHVQDHVAREEAAFSAFLDGTSVPEHPRSHGTEPIPNAFGARMPQQPFQVSNATDYSQTDGMEVVKLLDSGYEEVTQPESDVPLTTEEAMALRRALFQETPGSRRTGSHDPDWGSILNFFPGQSVPLGGFVHLLACVESSMCAFTYIMFRSNFASVPRKLEMTNSRLWDRLYIKW